MLHIKLKGMEHRAHTLSLHTPSTCRLDQKVQKSECGHVAYQIKGKEVETKIEEKTLPYAHP